MDCWVWVKLHVLPLSSEGATQVPLAGEPRLRHINAYWSLLYLSHFLISRQLNKRTWLRWFNFLYICNIAIEENITEQMHVPRNQWDQPFPAHLATAPSSAVVNLKTEHLPGFSFPFVLTLNPSMFQAHGFYLQLYPRWPPALYHDSYTCTIHIRSTQCPLSTSPAYRIYISQVRSVLILIWSNKLLTNLLRPHLIHLYAAVRLDF